LPKDGKKARDSGNGGWRGGDFQKGGPEEEEDMTTKAGEMGGKERWVGVRRENQREELESGIKD